MSQLVFLNERVAYLPGTNNLGVIVCAAGRVVVVDTGIDKEAARLLRRACEAAGLQIVATLLTHHHADHVGGNDYLERNIPGLTCYAPRREAPFIEDPYLEPSYLSYGAAPIAPLRNRFVMATPSIVHQRIEPGALTIETVTMQIVAIPGHSLAQVAVVIDNVCFAADGFFGAAVLNKYGLPYAHDVLAQLVSFDVVRALVVAHWIPGHGVLQSRDSIDTTLDANRQSIALGMELVREACAMPVSLQQIVAHVQQRLGLSSSALAQYAVFASGVSAYVTALHTQSELVVELTNEGPLWRQS
jgi:glyoxylase-like metal-dependent hydrolase (beta-lactamase superfamily II)